MHRGLSSCIIIIMLRGKFTIVQELSCRKLPWKGQRAFEDDNSVLERPKNSEKQLSWKNVTFAFSTDGQIAIHQPSCAVIWSRFLPRSTCIEVDNNYKHTGEH